MSMPCPKCNQTTNNPIEHDCKPYTKFDLFIIGVILFVLGLMIYIIIKGLSYYRGGL